MGRRYLNEEQKAHFKEARNKTMLERYGKKGFTNIEKVKQTKLERYDDENYNNQVKRKETCLKRYGVEHHNQYEPIANKISKSKLLPETQAKYENTMLERYGEKSPNLVPEIRAKYKQTLMEHYGVLNPLKNKEIYNKHIETMKKNGSFNKSKPEELFYDKLLEIYSKDDIIRQYSDERYPFNCDFYIKSQDLFIELNYHPSHNNHPFDENNVEDIKLLENLKQENSAWSNMIIDVWSVRDVAKLKVAKQNNLNYLFLYPSDNF